MAASSCASSTVLDTDDFALPDEAVFAEDFAPVFAAEVFLLAVLAALAALVAGAVITLGALGVGIVVQYQLPFASAQACPSLAVP
jgi:hypothetical protein